MPRGARRESIQQLLPLPSRQAAPPPPWGEAWDAGRRGRRPLRRGARDVVGAVPYDGGSRDIADAVPYRSRGLLLSNKRRCVHPRVVPINLTAPARVIRRAHSRTPNVRKLTSGNPYVSCRIPVLAPKAYIRTSRVRERGEENENWIKTKKTACGTADGFHH